MDKVKKLFELSTKVERLLYLENEAEQGYSLEETLESARNNLKDELELGANVDELLAEYQRLYDELTS